MSVPGAVLPAVTLTVAGFLLLACGGGGSGNEEDPPAEMSVGPAGDCPAGLEDGSERPEILRLVNEVRAQEQVCSGTGYPAVAPLVWDCRLEAAARGHSLDMAEHNFFDHTGSDGLGITDRITAVGYDWDRARENLVARNEAISAAEAVDEWLRSATHCASLMDAEVVDMGIAYVRDVTGSDFTSYWTQVMARHKRD